VSRPPVIPDAAVAHHTILLGKTRAGKSSTMRGIVERLLDQGKPVGIIDPKGDWWGLKSSADGKRAGYPVIIFGGEHADVPINALSGKHVAELVATGNRPFIIDLGGWMVGERTRFFIDFASTFFRHTRGPRHLAIDEVHNFSPQGKVHDPDAGKMLHWANRLASEGAGKGITLLSASQRPQKVHKDYLTSHETLIAMRVIHILDRNAVKDWLDGAPDKTLGKQVLDELASLNRGEAWVWSPEAKFGPARVRFPMFKTYDSFAAPTDQSTKKLKGWASVDLEDVKAKLESVVEEAKASDPAALKAEIARLKREAGKTQAPAPPSWPDQRNEVATLQREVKEAFEEGREQGIVDGLAMAREVLNNFGPPQRRKLAVARAQPVVEQEQPNVERIPRPAPPPPAISSDESPGLSGSQRQFLTALAWWDALGHKDPSRAQVAAIAGWRVTSGHLKNVSGSLKSAGLIEYPRPGHFALTDIGRRFAPEPDMSRKLHDTVRTNLNGSQQQVYDFLLRQDTRNPVARELLARSCGWEPTSGHVKNVLGSLKTLQIIDYPAPGQVALQTWLQ
jgi:hypothetical protein